MDEAEQFILSAFTDMKVFGQNGPKDPTALSKWKKLDDDNLTTQTQNVLDLLTGNLTGNGCSLIELAYKGNSKTNY